MEAGPTWLLTGSADEEVRVWSITHRSEKSVSIETSMRLIGHQVPVTCVRYGKLEVVSGDSLGRIFLWWLETGEVLRQCSVHKGPVRCMQFDATRIVSGGMDSMVCITDIGSGEVLQSLRGHSKPVLAVAFDTERIISASVDNKLKYWGWGRKTGPQDKYHILSKAETLVDVSKIYKVNVTDLMSWNGITALKQCYAGMSLIVIKGDPNKLTEAEEAALERSRRREAGLAYSKKKLGEVNLDTGLTSTKYDRVQRLATDNHAATLGNRLFKEEKSQTELFESSTLMDADAYSLASRIRNGGAITKNYSSNAHAPYIISPENVEEWGHVADALGQAMIDLFVEFTTYEIAQTEMAADTDKRSFAGRIKSTIAGQMETTNINRSDRMRKPKRLGSTRKEKKKVSFQAENGADDDKVNHLDELTSPAADGMITG